MPQMMSILKVHSQEILLVQSRVVNRLDNLGETSNCLFLSIIFIFFL
jgi:hypothetical protein